jgi:hypothetical protein
LGLFMRAGVCAVIAALCGSGFSSVPARADGSPVFVVPGKPGVPVIVNPLGFDASYTVVEGDFGLSRPGQVNPMIVGGPLIRPEPLRYGAYFPHSGRLPGYGRYEIEPPPNRRLPRPAQTYRRSWSAGSDPIPATLDPPARTPDINVDVDVDGGGDGDRDRRWRRDRDRRDRRDRHERRGHHGRR